MADDPVESNGVPNKTPLLDVNLVIVNVSGDSGTQISRDVRALQLTNDWYIVDENGDGVGYNADSFHPLQKPDGYDDVPLNLTGSGTVTLSFGDNHPLQSVSVQRWNAEYAGTDSADIWDKGEPINVVGNSFQISDDGIDYIYEVYAKWNEGDSWYVFCINSTNHISQSASQLDDIASESPSVGEYWDGGVPEQVPGVMTIFVWKDDDGTTRYTINDGLTIPYRSSYFSVGSKFFMHYR